MYLTGVESEALLVKHKDAWILGGSARRRLAAAYDGDSAFPIVPYLTTDIAHQSAAALDWVDAFGAVTSGDLQTLTGTARGTAKRTLDVLVADGRLTTAGSGRSSRYERPTEAS